MSAEIIAYNPKLKEYARQLRKNMTLAEVLLWKRLSRRQMMGYDFDRQRPIDEYIVDFYCKHLQLAIEVDGKSHNFKLERDAHRERRLNDLGVSVLRFWDAEVKKDMKSVLDRIKAWILEREETHPPLRGPLQGGEFRDRTAQRGSPPPEGCPKGGVGSAER